MTFVIELLYHFPLCQDETPFAYACHQGRLSAAKMLFEHKADPQARDCNDEDPLMLSASGGHVSVVKWLLESVQVHPSAANKVSCTRIDCSNFPPP